MRRPLMLPAWLFDVAHAVISMGFGLGLLLWRNETLVAVARIVALYLLVDGLLDILSFARNRSRQDIGSARLAIGVLSCATAGLSLVDPALAVRLFVY